MPGIDDEPTNGHSTNDAGAAPASEGAAAPAAETGGSAGAVDTGRRVDPSQLAGAGPRTMMRKDGPPPRGPPRAEGGAPAADGNGAGAPRGDGAGRGGPPRVREFVPQKRPDRPRGDKPRGDGPRGPGRPFGDAQQSRADRGPAPIDRMPTSLEDAGDFAAMLAESGPVDHVDIRIGDTVKGKVVHIGKDTVFFQLSGTQEAYMPTAEFLDEQGGLHIAMGDRVEAFVVGLDQGVLLSKKIAKGMVDTAMLEQARASGMPIEGTVIGVNKGGLEVELAGVKGFCPIGQADIHFVEDPTKFVGKTLAFLVKEVKEGGRNILLSRKALLERERKQKADRLLKDLVPGAIIEGTITRIQPFGAFVDLGGLDGLIPVSELSHVRIGDPSEVVKLGEHVRVEVMKIEDDPKRPGQMRIGLSLKTLLDDPFDQYAAQLVVGATLEGRVARLETYGAFVELFPGVQGLMHVSEIADQRIRHPMDVLQPDERVKVRVLDFDRGTRRVSLSMREAAERVEAPAGPSPNEKRSGGLARGTQLDGVVERIERYGVFVKLEVPNGTGVSGLMPASETGTERGTDLHKAFPIGTKMSVLVIDIDERGRVKVSKIAREAAEERAIVAQFASAQGNAGFGTFGDLLKKRGK